MCGDLTLDGNLVLRESCALILILDTGAQANVVGPEFAHLLIRRRPPPADLRLFGAGDARLVVTDMGTLIVTLAPSSNPRAGLGALPRRANQLLRAQSGFRVGMVSDRTQRSDRHTPGRGRRPAGASGPARQTPPTRARRGSSELTLAPGIPVVDAAARLAFFDRPTFFAFLGT